MKSTTHHHRHKSQQSASFFGATPKSNSFFATNIQRRQTSEEEDAIQTMPLMSKSENGGYQATPRLTSQLSQSKGGGSSLPVPTLNYMNQAFGADFLNVRVHTGSQAQEMSQRIQAKAFTHGSDIYFNMGQYSPKSSDGKKLLAHELTHVVQQTTKKPTTIQPYRSKDSMNFGISDGTGYQFLEDEDSFHKKKDKETKPWIELIKINFDKIEPDVNGFQTQKGKLSYQYYNNSEAWPDWEIPVTGGSKNLGRADRGNFKVHRIEGLGYNSGTYSDASIPRDPKNRRYSLDPDVANMHYAVFYNGGEAIHIGSLYESSHGCVHVDDWSEMQQINYHAVIGLTKVKVTSSV